MSFDIERREKIEKDHPNLFPKHIGFEHGDGWLGIIEELCDKLEPLIVQFIKENPGAEDDEHPSVSQIKEKYGTLRFYMWTETDEMSDLIKRAEEKSETTCEICGEPGYTRGTGWLSTRCDKCVRQR